MTSKVSIILSVAEILSIAIKRNDITPDVAVALKQQYSESNNDKIKLLNIIYELTKDRIRFLSLESYDNLDEEGLLPELKEKYFFGFKYVYFLRFGIEYGSNTKNKFKGNIGEMLLKFAVDNGVIIPLREANLKHIYSTDSDEKSLYDAVLKDIQNYILNFESMDYDKLKEKGLLDTVKEIYYSCFLQKYLLKFGFEYKPIL
jgi:hypothetical protein